VTEIVMALGRTAGPDGVAVLRELLSEAAGEYVRGVAGTGLAMRLGAGATGDLLRALESTGDGGCRRALLVALACVGDGRGWAQVLEVLRDYLEGLPAEPVGDLAGWPLLVYQTDLLPPLCYLGRHARGDERRVVAEVVRSRWRRIYPAERQWLTVHWWACDPAHPLGSQAPDPAWLATVFAEYLAPPD
jgi:hypothetical protein